MAKKPNEKVSLDLLVLSKFPNVCGHDIEVASDFVEALIRFYVAHGEGNIFTAMVMQDVFEYVDRTLQAVE